MTSSLDFVQQLRKEFGYTTEPKPRGRSQHLGPKPAPSPEVLERQAEMCRLRFEEEWTNTRIGEFYGISRERVRQIIGNTGHFVQKKKTAQKKAAKELTASLKAEKKQQLLDAIRSPENAFLTNTELAKRLGRSDQFISENRADLWHVVEPDTRLGTGQKWELWVSDRLTSLGIEHKMMPPSHPFDILLNSGIAIDVKSTGFSQDFGGSECPFIVGLRNYSRDKCDFLIAVIQETVIAFIIPTNGLPQSRLALYLRTPSKYSQYREAWSLILNHGKEL